MTTSTKKRIKKKSTVRRHATKKRAVAKRRARVSKPLAASAVVLASAAVPAIGKPWDGQSGIRIGEFAGENGKPGYHLLLATDADGKPIVLNSQRWGEYGQDVTGATSLNDGAANTDAMIAAGSPLAKAVRALGDDCYLPALCELQAAFAHARDLLPKEWLWSSTQFSSTYAWYQTFSSGLTYRWYKNYSLRALVVRRVPIQAQ
ncbi:MAG TPA: DUF1566 domain-containing protein [Gammaproteobacteria bacterium]|jgi:hypothetical protein